MKHRRLWIQVTRLGWLAGLAIVPALVGCSGQPAPPPTPTTPPTPTATVQSSGAGSEGQLEGWTRYEQADEGFAISLPPGWQQMDLDPQTVRESMQNVLKDNPQMAEALGEQAQSMAASGVKFWGFDMSDLSSDSPSVTNVNVLVTDVPENVTLDQYEQVNAEQLEQMATDVKHERVNLPAGEAIKFTSTLGTSTQSGSIQQSLTQYALLESGKSYIITFTTEASKLAGNAQTFQKIAESFELLR